MSNWVSVKSSRSSTTPMPSRSGTSSRASSIRIGASSRSAQRSRQFPLGASGRRCVLVSSMCSTSCVRSSATMPSSETAIAIPLIHGAYYGRVRRRHSGSCGPYVSRSCVVPDLRCNRVLQAVNCVHRERPPPMMSYDGPHATGLDAVGDPGALHVRQLPVLPAGRNHRFHLAPSPTLATLPVSVLILGLAASVVPAGALIRRFGRRAVFAGSALLAAIGCVAAGAAITPGSFAAFLRRGLPARRQQRGRHAVSLRVGRIRRTGTREPRDLRSS